jgi:hypothetical protein
MAKIDPTSSDPKKRFSGVKQQPGEVQQDSDWNRSKTDRRFSGVKQKQGEVKEDSDWNKPPANRLLRWGLGLVVAAVVLVAGFVLWQRLQPKPEPVTLVTLINPSNGDFLPLHGTYSVSGEATSPTNIRELQLIVNGQPWGSRNFENPSPFVDGLWQWTPSGEGTHELLLRAIDVSGQVHESQVVHVLVSAQADVLFPLKIAADSGDTLESLAEEYGASAQGLIDNYPEYNPSGPLPDGALIDIPVSIPNAEPAGPEGGAPAAPPANPLPDPQDLIIFPIFVEGTKSNFTLIDGKIVPGQPLDIMYLYISLDGETPWRRIPDDPLSFLQPGFNGFDITQYINVEELEASDVVHTLHIEAWGWKSGTLVYLGSSTVNIGGGLSGWPPSDTQLQIETHKVIGIPKYAHEYNIVGENPNRVVKFDWSAAKPAFFIKWQISTEPFPAAGNATPAGLVMEKLMFGGQDGQFDIDFSQFFKQPASSGFFGSLVEGVKDVTNSVTGAEETSKTFPDFLPMTFYVRILAALPGGGSSPSNTVIVRYLPTGEVLTNLSPSGPIYETQIIEYIPFRPADPAYAACTVLTKDIIYQSKNSSGEVTTQVLMPEGTESCGCPGVKCSSGSSSDCDIEPWKWGNCLADAGEWFVNAVKDTVNYAANLYNDAKSYLINTIASFACGLINDPDAKKACELGVNVAANVAITAFTGIPPEIPNFDKLMDEGLEYAIASVAAQVTGVECDKTCRDLLKKGFEGISNPDQLYEEGLNYGAKLAADELEDLGVECNVNCRNVIRQGVQGDLDLTFLSPSQIEAKFKQLAHNAAQQIVAQGIACDAACENAIFEGYMNGANLGQSAAQASANSPTPAQPDWVPHELAQKQPAVLKIRVFRRFESAQLNEDIIAERCTGFSIDSLATNNGYNINLSGRLFEPKFIDVPLIEPGGSFVIPVVLDEATWELPAGFDWSQIPPWMMGYTDLGTENGEPIGQVQQQLNLDAWWMWNVLNYGAHVEFKTFGPYMLDVVDGQSMGFPCFSEASQSFENP